MFPSFKAGSAVALGLALLTSCDTVERGEQCPDLGDGNPQNYAKQPEEYRPRFSRDGSQVLYVHNDGLQLRVLDVATGTSRHVATGVLEASWFQRPKRAPGIDEPEVQDSAIVTLRDQNLYVASLDGRLGRPLTTDGRTNFLADVSRDGRTLVWTKDGCEPWTMDLETGEARPVPKRGVLHCWGAGDWSPDDSFIAHTRSGGGPDGFASVYLMDREGTGVVRLTYEHRIDQDPVVDPFTGRFVVYASYGCGTWQDLYFYDLRARRERRLTVGGATQPDVSPDGKRVVYVGHTAGPHPVSSDPYGYLFVLDLDTGRKTQLTSEET